MTEPTGGKWELVYDGIQPIIRSGADTRIVVAQACWDNNPAHKMSEAEAWANARLMVASPEMMALLKEVVGKPLHALTLVREGMYDCHFCSWRGLPLVSLIHDAGCLVLRVQQLLAGMKNDSSRD